MASHNSAVHIVTARARIQQDNGQHNPTENQLVTIARNPKRARPGIANVELIPTAEIEGSLPCGIALYDRQHKTGVSDVSILILGVAEITCTFCTNTIFVFTTNACWNSFAKR